MIPKILNGVIFTNCWGMSRNEYDKINENLIWKLK